MARNAHPEVTEQRILDAARELFMEQGYEKTSVQDIVDRLGDLSKGAIYHHFKSKQTILDRLGDDDARRIGEQSKAVFEREDLDGLHKIRELFKLSASDESHRDINRVAMPLLDDPTYFTDNMRFWSAELPKHFRPLIDEGVQDGSIPTEYPQEAAEMLALLTNYWLLPHFYPATASQLEHRIRCLAAMLDAIGVPVFDDELIAMTARLYTDFGG
ncbi:MULTISPECIES: TetR/AcrR family transcriptional regulator [Bifidobacterium]|uniref:TetR/AcrR family transcriptional regulator n=1 Tax=Bifidobacterium TaxID=1678 RepID=UPI001BDBD52C|nr:MULTISPECIES: TetR/AcrR family transcriptional regulator [Bifidobacterium]MBT1161562.1 TetR/AcrR family transcriptional regulator [Bifidobacterium sp. SO1]MBW3078938.1 TetR/AcrR family transcriptional regulator [Bifidobacterium simiiventris]